MAAGGVVPSLVYFGYLYMASLFFSSNFFLYLYIFGHQQTKPYDEEHRKPGLALHDARLRFLVNTFPTPSFKLMMILIQPNNLMPRCWTTVGNQIT